jgi:hypothetical protein
MGAYVYKATKFVPYRMGELGFFDFWYKPSYSYDTSKAQRMREVVMDRMWEKRPNGVRYIAHAPTRLNKWDKNKLCLIYKVPDSLQGMPVVVNDMSKQFDSFALENIISVCTASKSGKIKEIFDDDVLVDEILHQCKGYDIYEALKDTSPRLALLVKKRLDSLVPALY